MERSGKRETASPDYAALHPGYQCSAAVDPSCNESSPMKLDLGADALTVTLEGWERVWALRRRLIIPRGKIVHAEWHGEPFELRTTLRLAGTGVPGAIAAGTFYGHGMKQFFYLRRPQGWWGLTVANVLVLDLRDMFYHRVVLSCAEEDAARVVAWARAAS
jgi:hypothetical protein